MSKCSKSTKCCYVTSSLLLLWTLNIISDQAGNTSVQTGWYPISISRDRYTQRLSGAGEELMRCSQKTQRLLCVCLDVLCSLIRADATFAPILSSSLFIVQKTTIVSLRASSPNYYRTVKRCTTTNNWLDSCTKRAHRHWNQSQNDHKFQVLLTNEQT